MGTPNLRYPTEVHGVPVPLNEHGTPDVNTIVGLAASLLARADYEDGEARSWQDARNATGHVTLNTFTLRPLIEAAVRAASADGQPVLAVREPGSRDPIRLESGDRVRLVIEGTVESLREGVFGGAFPVIRTDRGEVYEPNHPTLIATRIERLAPADGTMTS